MKNAEIYNKDQLAGFLEDKSYDKDEIDDMILQIESSIKETFNGSYMEFTDENFLIQDEEFKWSFNKEDNKIELVDDRHGDFIVVKELDKDKNKLEINYNLHKGMQEGQVLIVFLTLKRFKKRA